MKAHSFPKFLGGPIGGERERGRKSEAGKEAADG